MLQPVSDILKKFYICSTVNNDRFLCISSTPTDPEPCDLGRAKHTQITVGDSWRLIYFGSCLNFSHLFLMSILKCTNLTMTLGYILFQIYNCKFLKKARLSFQLEICVLGLCLDSLSGFSGLSKQVIILVFCGTRTVLSTKG